MPTPLRSKSSVRCICASASLPLGLTALAYESPKGAVTCVSALSSTQPRPSPPVEKAAKASCVVA